MKNNFQLFITFIALLFVACETVIEVDLPKYTPKLVIDGSFSPGNHWQLLVSKSTDILDLNDPGHINNASIKIISDNEEIELNYDSPSTNLYVNKNQIPEVGKRYTLQVSVPGYETVTAKSIIPSPTQIISYSTTNYVENDFGYKRNLVELTLTLKDKPGEDNYYHLAIYEQYSDRSTDYQKIWFSTDNAAIVSENGEGIGDDVSFSGDGAVFSDFLFSGDEYKIKLKEIYHSEDTPLIIALSAITEELFQYKKGFDNGNREAGPFSEPEPHYTNIENGLGIFAGFNTTFVEVQ